MNNLFRYVMSDFLPYGGFKWLKNVDIQSAKKVQ